MKKLFILFLFSTSGFLFSQEDYTLSDSLETSPIYENSISNEDVVYDGIEEEVAAYLGGMNTLYKDIANNLEYPNVALEHETQGKVLIRFIIEKDGTISNLTIIQDIGSDCGAEAIRVLKLTSGRWIPAKVNGKPVRSKFTQPIVFRLAS